MMRALLLLAGFSVVTGCYLPDRKYACGSDAECALTSYPRCDNGVCVPRATGSSSSSGASPSSSAMASSLVQSSSLLAPSSSPGGSSSIVSSSAGVSSSAAPSSSAPAPCETCALGDGGFLCTDLLVDPDNCAACGNACGAGEDCVMGHCFAAITAGLHHTCALQLGPSSTDGVGRCWGDNSHGALGSPGTPGGATPLTITSHAGFDPAHLAGVYAYGEMTCGRTTQDQLFCWGGSLPSRLLRTGCDGGYSCLAEPMPATPIETTGLDAVALGEGHLCVGTPHQVQCMGDDFAGEALHGGPVVFDGGVLSLAAGGEETCVVVGTGSGQQLRCAGRVHTATLPAATTCGAGECSPELSNVTSVNDVANPRRIAVGATIGCLVTPADTVRCWGLNASNFGGQTGQGIRNRDGGTLTGVASVRVGDLHACALTRLGKLYCWGKNPLAQLGFPLQSGDFSATEVPPPDAGVPNSRWTALACGANHTCALDSQRKAWCWGDDAASQLGHFNLQDEDVTCRNGNGNPCRLPTPVPDF